MLQMPFSLAPARRAGSWLLMAVGAAFALPAGADRPLPAGARTPLPPVEGEVIVKFKATADLTRQYALSARAEASTVRNVLSERANVMGARLGRTLQAGPAVGANIQVLRASGISAAELAAQLAADPDVEFAEPNQRMRRTAAPNDPLYAVSATERRSNGPSMQDGPASGQWYMRAPTAAVPVISTDVVSSTNLEAAWARTRGSGSVVVAVLDTGVRFDHPDLVGRLLPGYDFVANPIVANDGGGRDSDPSDPGDWLTAAEAATSTFGGCTASDSSWHGTSTASLVGANSNDSIGMAGAASGVRVLPVRVLGKCFGESADIQAAIRWAAGISVPGVPDNPNPAKVINLSLGGGGECSAGYRAAVSEVVARGVVVVAAAGNSAGGAVSAPASCPDVIAVAGLRHAGTKVGFSDLGPQIGIAAPAGNCINITAGSPCLYPILAATNTGPQGPLGSTWTDSYNITVGTSFASPLVAATAALMLSTQSTLTGSQVLGAMQATARPFPSTGGDNGDGSIVRQCTAPRPGVDQLQCYCNTTFCGAGILDSNAALASVAPTSFVNISSSASAAISGDSVTFRITGLQLPAGRTVAAYAWTLSGVDANVASFSSSTNAEIAVIRFAGAGTVVVSLAVTDSSGTVTLTSQSLVVAPAPVTTPPTTPTPPATGGSGGGGGSMSLAWLAALALAVAALFRASAPTPTPRPARPRKA
jgi:serine protease